MGKLTLVGAGPGDIDLITMKGIKAIKSADILLYDALANKDLIKLAPKHAKTIFVGKKAGLHFYKQDKIHELIVSYVHQGKHVVRLKGGDPFIFGRGHEELEIAIKENIEVSVVPGISSSIGVATSEFIPLTKRGVNESFWVVTGTLKSGKPSKDISLAAQSSATMVILMGMKHIKEIIAICTKYRGLNEPVAIIQNGTTDQVQKIYGNTSNIETLLTKAKLKAPSIIIVGEVIEHRLTQIISKYAQQAS